MNGLTATAKPTSFFTGTANAVLNTGNAIKNAALNTGNAITNAALNTGNAIKNVANTALTNATNAVNVFPMPASIKNITAPINASINAVPSDAAPLFVSLPIILGVGIVVILIVLILMFKDQLTSIMTKFFSNVTKAPEVLVKDVEYGAETIAQDLDIVNKVVPTRKQVFNVSENKYTYNDAEPLCKALGAELATYDQVQQSWDQGADWCNYGWIKGQGAVYPTQKDTFDSLQSGTSDDERLACGTVGINGGFMDNPELRFGVNCYGEKPTESTHDLKNMLQNQIPPLTPDVLEQRKKMLRYKSEQGQIGVMPFRQGAWSQ